MCRVPENPTQTKAFLLTRTQPEQKSQTRLADLNPTQKIANPPENGVKKFLVHCDFVMDSTEGETVIIIVITQVL